MISQNYSGQLQPPLLVRTDEHEPASSMLGVLWRRRWTLLVTMVVCIGLASAYLAVAKRVYRAVSTIRVDEMPPKAIGENNGPSVRTENFAQTQAAALESASVLAKALESLNYRSLETFKEAKGDPVDWLRRNGLAVEVLRKTDVIAVTMDSPYPDEAVKIVSAIIDSYLAQQSNRGKTLATHLLAALSQQHERLKKQEEDAVRSLIQYQLDHPGVAKADDQTNVVLARLKTLSSSLTEAELTRMQLEAASQSAKAAIEDPKLLATFIGSLQSRGGWADAEYTALKTQLNQQTVARALMNEVHGDASPRVQQFNAVIESIKAQIAEKEKSIASAYLMSVTEQLTAIQAKEKEIRAALDKQHKEAQAIEELVPTYRKLEAEVARVRAEREQVTRRITELTVTGDSPAGTLSTELLEPAHVVHRPVKPNRTLVLAAATMLGWIMGIGLALFREQRDTRLHSVKEISPLLGTPVLAMIPPLSRRMPMAVRGRVMLEDSRSLAAEAYRELRTSVQLGNASDAKVIVVCSPASGDGKSTTASNLAIAFAQAGEQTLLIDCDLRQPVQHQVFGIPNRVGLSSMVLHGTSAADSLVRTDLPGLCLLPAGPIPTNPAEILSSRRFNEILIQLKLAFDRIIIDTPAMLDVTDARIIASKADASLLVLRINNSMRELGIAAVAGLLDVGARVLGAVANGVARERGYAGYGLPRMKSDGVENGAVIGHVAGTQQEDYYPLVNSTGDDKRDVEPTAALEPTVLQAGAK